MTILIQPLIRALAAIAPALFLLSAGCHAETRRFGDYVVHYSVFQSSLLPPVTATAYGLVRARDRAVLNVVVQRGNGEAVPATVTGTRSDLIHPHALEFREIREEQASYHIADFGFVSAETLYFALDIRPAEAASGFSLKFSHTLYDD